ncbi:MAG: flagellar biosynthesis regulator FlaF [Alphaproteobacteria bacterium]
MANPYSDQNRMALMNAPANKAEGWALVELARRLDNAKKDQDGSKIKEIVRLNWRVWTIIQSAMLDPQTEVPINVRSNLVNLSNFIDKRSVDILGAPDPLKLDVLININRQIGAGLLGNPADDPEESERLRDQHHQQLDQGKAALDHMLTPAQLDQAAATKTQLPATQAAGRSGEPPAPTTPAPTTPAPATQAPTTQAPATPPTAQAPADSAYSSQPNSSQASPSAALPTSPTNPTGIDRALADKLEQEKRDKRAETLRRVLANRSLQKKS